MLCSLICESFKALYLHVIHKILHNKNKDVLFYVRVCLYSSLSQNLVIAAFWPAVSPYSPGSACTAVAGEMRRKRLRAQTQM